MSVLRRFQKGNVGAWSRWSRFYRMREVHGRVGIILRGIQGSCYRLCFSKMKPRLKHEATKELRQISTSNSICLHRFVSGFDSCWTYRLHASHDYRKIFKRFVFLASPKNPGCYSHASPNPSPSVSPTTTTNHHTSKTTNPLANVPIPITQFPPAQPKPRSPT